MPKQYNIKSAIHVLRNYRRQQSPQKAYWRTKRPTRYIQPPPSLPPLRVPLKPKPTPPPVAKPKRTFPPIPVVNERGVSFGKPLSKTQRDQMMSNYQNHLDHLVAAAPVRRNNYYEGHYVKPKSAAQQKIDDKHERLWQKKQQEWRDRHKTIPQPEMPIPYGPHLPTRTYEDDQGYMVYEDYIPVKEKLIELDKLAHIIEAKKRKLKK